MGFSTPRTWSAGETVTASLMNAHLRDNLNATAPKMAWVSIGSPDGADLTTGVKARIWFSFPCKITGWTILADASGSVVVDVWKDSYCVDEETEALTRRGWKGWSEVGPDDDLLGFSAETGFTSWQRPSGFFLDKDYQGPMIRIGGTGSRIDALVTPNHAWPVVRIVGRDERRLPIERIETRDLPSKGLLLRSAPYSGPSRTLDDALVRLAAWFFTEGSTRANGTIAAISQSERVNPDKCAAIREDLVALGAEWSESVGDGKPRRDGQRGSLRRGGLWVREHRRPDDCVQFTLTGDGVDAMLSLFVDKVPTPEFVAALTADQARMFVETALLGDGNGDAIFYQHDDERMSAFMAIAVLAGFSPSLDVAGGTCCLRKSRPYTWIKDTPRSTEMYTGVIWCPTMPTGYWVARRRGRVFITGNSNHPPTVADTIAGTEKPTLSGAQKNQDLTLTTWSQNVAAGDVVFFNIDSVSGLKQVFLGLSLEPL